MVVQTQPVAPPRRPVAAPQRPVRQPFGVLRVALGWAVFLCLWELVGRTVLAGTHLIGVPSRILLKLVENAEVYGRGLWFTTREALLGYLLGNAAAILLVLVVVLLPQLERLVLAPSMPSRVRSSRFSWTCSSVNQPNP